MRAVRNRLLWRIADRKLQRQIARVETYLRKKGRWAEAERPVLFFNASTRIHRLSLNGAFSLLASWALRAQGVPVRYLVCQRGMEVCILGTSLKDYASPPPCVRCTRFSQVLFPADLVVPLEFDQGEAQAAGAALEGRSLQDLAEWSWKGLPLGELCLPGLRWALRRHHLPDDEPTRQLYRRYLRSAASLAARVEIVLDRLRPRALVVFNGLTYPEAVARRVARGKGIPVITHEVGLRPYSAFFSHEDATFREVEIPPEFELGPTEDAQLDRYLEDRKLGRFTMAGIRFWPEMRPLPDWLEERLRAHRQMVPVFTNVVFDTSQVHANALFADMFEWLDDLREVIDWHPETLFVLRAHPDEDRPGKESRESVADWAARLGLGRCPNVAFFAPSEYVSSYELIQGAKFVMVYNSSVGLEASILGKPVLCAGRARYTQLPTVFFPSSREAYRGQLEAFLRDAVIDVPLEFATNARRFLFYELYRASLDLSSFLRPFPQAPGMVLFEAFDPHTLEAESNLAAICSGILAGGRLVLPERQAFTS
ncbi:MAG: hypothetical protein AB1449_01260 [Chloroflexota bacterium]